MQVANALNNIIRILYNPKVEVIKLFDILLVKSENERYLAQVIELFTDKFDTAQNVAKLKLFYKINENDEVIPYDNFTPSKECEIIKINQKEVENFINENSPTFEFGINTKNDLPFEIRQDFFNNNPIIFADKAEKACELSISIAKGLSDIKNAVILDFTGVMDIDGAKKIKASKDFQMLLNASNLDFVFEKFLSDGSLEFQSLGMEILSQLRKFAKVQKDGFIPFDNFVKVLEVQLGATNRAEIQVLIARLKKCQEENIFLNNPKNKNVLLKTIAENKITIVDLSPLNTAFQKRCFENLIEDIKTDVYLFVRINDDNSDIGLINKIYNKKKNIRFIPNVSYNLKKLPYLMQNCENYILLPSLYQRTDLIEMHSRLSSSINEGCIIFGKDTENFIYFVKDYEIDNNTKKTSYRKIALSFVKEDVQPVVELKANNISKDSKILLEELGSEDDLDVDFYREIEAPKETLEEDFSNTLEQETSFEDDLDEPEEVESYKQNLANNIEEDEEYKSGESTPAQDDIETVGEVQEVREENKQNDIEPQNIFDEAVLDNIDEQKSLQGAEENEDIVLDDKSEIQNNEANLSDEELDFFEASQEITEMDEDIEENQKASEIEEFNQEDIEIEEDNKEPQENLQIQEENDNPEEDIKPKEFENISKEEELIVDDFEEALRNNLEQVELQNGSEVLGESSEQKTVLVDNVEYKTQNGESAPISDQDSQDKIEQYKQEDNKIEEPLEIDTGVELISNDAVLNISDDVQIQDEQNAIAENTNIQNVQDSVNEMNLEVSETIEIAEEENNQDNNKDTEETFAQNLQEAALQAHIDDEIIINKEENPKSAEIVENTDSIETIQDAKPETVDELKESEENKEDTNAIELANDEEIDIQSDDIDLSLVAGNSINESFEQIINEQSNQEIIELKIDEETKIDENILTNKANENEDLPIFKEEIKTDKMNTQVYEVGSIVSHKKYGTGKVVKTIQYEQRQLLQIEFNEAGKKLLDPVVADIKLEQ